MKIPQKLNIGGIIYDIDVIDFKHNDLTEDKLWGQINFKDCKILLNATVNCQLLEQTFFHEVIHGLAVKNCIELNEQEISLMSSDLYQVLKENKLLKD